MNVNLYFDTIGKLNVYSVTIDDQPWCRTSNDDEGLALGIAIAQLQLKRNMEGK
jgi:hypothetical protein